MNKCIQLIVLKKKQKILYWIKTKLDCIKSIKTIPMNK